MKIRALSVHNRTAAPWCDWIACGLKRLEIRSRATKHRGPLAICSTKRPKTNRPGELICVVDVVDCRPMAPEDATLARVPYQDGAWAWVLENPRLCLGHIKVKGQQGLYWVDVPGKDAQWPPCPPRHNRKKTVPKAGLEPARRF